MRIDFLEQHVHYLLHMFDRWLMDLLVVVLIDEKHDWVKGFKGSGYLII